ncbi:MAG: outer membrane protein assembly factor BamA [Candidatus Aceula meridiana]|nr:outer membrane protein assembly factor BamA [Candidatus Aceula meridiana]
MKKVNLILWISIFVLIVNSNVWAQYGSATADKDMLADVQSQASADLAAQQAAAEKSESSLRMPEDIIEEVPKIETPEVPLDLKETVKGIEIEGNKTIGITTILAKIKTRVGDPYIANIISDDIKRLYNTGYFSDVAVEKEDHEGGIKVVIHLKEKAVIEDVTFSKTRFYSHRTLKLKIKSKEGRFLDGRSLKDDIKTIQELYAKKGLTSAIVKSSSEIDEETGKAKVHFEIDEGQRVKIKKIVFSGNDTFSYKRLMHVIKTRHDTLFTSGYLKEDIIEEDMDRLKAFYASKGFLDMATSYSYEQAPKARLILHIDVKEGKQYHVGSIIINGNERIFSDEEILGMMENVKVSGIFTPMNLETDTAAIREKYFDKGHIFCVVGESVSEGTEVGKVDVLLTIEEGEIAYVSKVYVQGNARTRDIVIRREMRLLPGDVFDGAKLRRSKERLTNLGFFEEIDYDVKDTKYPNKKDLVVQVKEAKTGSFSFGGGYSTVDKLVGFVEVNQKNFDFANWPTFTGGGQNLSLRAEIGSVRNNARLSFTEPWLFDYPVSGGFDIYRNAIDQDEDVGYGYSEKRLGGDLRLGKQFGEYLSGSTIYRLEEITIKDVVDDASDDLKDEQGKNVVSTLSFNLTHDSRDNVFSPTRGLVLSGTTDLAGGFLGGDKDFYRLQGKASYHIPVFGKTVLEFRGRVGIADAYGDTNEVPIYERFFAGGAYTIRGYNERKVGPLDERSEDPIGGEALLVGNVEYTVPILDFVKVAAFFDTGNVWRRMKDLGNGGYKSGMGLGLRVKTPLGPINLDYGYPLNDEPGEDERSGKFYFSISRSF